MNPTSISIEKPLKFIGLMSGTSLDGLDIVGVRFTDDNSYFIDFFDSVPYPADVKNRLAGAPQLSGVQLALFENEYTEWVAGHVAAAVDRHDYAGACIGAHGHTVFHQPEAGLTLQILNGASLSARTGLTVVSDFRRADVALGGQGAPLVPIGDRILFGEYDACLNIGGFANLSREADGKRIAFDITAANIVLNELAGRLGHDYDEDGRLARPGTLHPDLLQTLAAPEYYRRSPPKSLGREWVETHITPAITDGALPAIDILHTFTHHIADQIGAALQPLGTSARVLITGGGAFNTYLMEILTTRTPARLILPDPTLIEAKEALIFALLAKLRLENRTNVLGSVTGSESDHCAGSVHDPFV